MLFFWTFWAFNQIFFWQNDRKWPGNTQLASLCKHEHQIATSCAFRGKPAMKTYHGYTDNMNELMVTYPMFGEFQPTNSCIKIRHILVFPCNGIFPSNPTCTYILASMPINGTWVTWTTHQIWRIILNFQTVVVWLQIRFFIWSLHFDLSLS